MTILVTRPLPEGDELVTRLRESGKTAWSMPLIDFIPGRDLAALSGLLASLQPGDMLFALSQHAVRYTRQILGQTDARWPVSVNYYAIGYKTAQLLQQASFQPVVWPIEQATSENLIKLLPLSQLKNKKALILRGNGGRNLLAKILSAHGADVKNVECYQRCATIYQGAVEGRRWRQRQITTLVVTSGEMLQLLWKLFPETDRERWLLHCRLIVVSTRLATLARGLGWRDIKVAGGADNDTLLQALQ